MTGSMDDDLEGRVLWNRFSTERGGPPESDCPDFNILGAYLGGVASEEEAQRIEQHLAACESCLEILMNAPSVLEAGGVPVPEALIARAKALVPGEKPVVPGYFKQAVWWAGAAAILAAVCFAGYRLGQDASELETIPFALTETMLDPVRFPGFGT